MAKVRWTGDGDREVAFVDVGGVGCEVAATRLEWVDVPPRVARALAEQDGWETEMRTEPKKGAPQHAPDEGDGK